jgi:hypothetical protein
MSTNKPNSASNFLGTALKGGAIAAVVNLGLYFAVSAAGVEFLGQFDPAGPQDMALPVPMVAVASIVPALFAGLLALTLRKFTPKAGVIFLAISVGFTLFSFMGPVGIVGASLGTKLALNAMHVVAAFAIALPLLRGPLRINP